MFPMKNSMKRGVAGKERGVMLLEALIAILIFSMGVLALVGLQAAAIKNTADAKHRVDAAFLANQIIAQMWVEDPANLPAYAHQPTTTDTCAFSGTASGNANVLAWLGDPSDATERGTVAASLPGATAANQQIAVDARIEGGTVVGARVTVTICWRHPEEDRPHNYIAVAEMNGI